MSTTTISETVSKKRERGRPRRFSTDRIIDLHSRFPNVCTFRQLTAKAYEVEATRRLVEEGKVIDGVDEIIGDKCRCTVLEQLGRLAVESGASTDEVRLVARTLSARIGREKLTTRQSVEILKCLRRHVRDGGAK